jgi:hypothetical protein
MRDVAFVSEYFAKYLLQQFGNRRLVIGVARSQDKALATLPCR